MTRRKPVHQVVRVTEGGTRIVKCEPDKPGHEWSGASCVHPEDRGALRRRREAKR